MPGFYHLNTIINQSIELFFNSSGLYIKTVNIVTIHYNF